MLHYVDETQPSVDNANQNTTVKFVENVPRSTFRRYWRSSGDQPTNPQTVNTPKEGVPAQNVSNLPTSNKNNNNINMDPKPKEEKSGTPKILPAADLSIFQLAPRILKKTIEILETENHTMLLDSSDEDEVVEVKLPPKPTITIESSDEDEVCIIDKQDSIPRTVTENTILNTGNREVSASPVPSVVSSVSDEFIRGDCIALNISSKNQGNHSFDFSLHGSDLLGQETPTKKKKKNKSKETATSTPTNTAQEKSTKTNSPTIADTCFATPKSKAKNKKQKSKSYVVTEISVPNADVYDSDSNQSVIDSNKKQVAYSVTEKSFPNTDVYESDSSQSETCKKSKTDNIVGSSESLISLDLSEIESNIMNNSNCSIVDLTESDNYITLDSTGITESIEMGNVTGFQESEDYGDDPIIHGDNAPKLGSTKVPQILFENLDFDNLKGKDKVCKGRRYSLTTLRAEMEKFYNESWGGEDFNHREIQKYMSRDKNLWVIDPKDRMPTLSKRKAICNYCNRSGHRDDTCRMKPPVCYMCGSTGHYEPRCPSKICVNCGSPNHMYSSMCRNCAWWARITCAECGQRGHPTTHCPDLWRRYHNTVRHYIIMYADNEVTRQRTALTCGAATTTR
ncbi:unnamed protein product [Chilo suppressalis]|uniref:Zinc finger CCHC domain-containing protein 7 n=1 Tax=Chilo suppressalis TaxID=168631 RepID=A0ABN8BE20_CHISP|nr:unnamed protein product [Chilo suppressalis]